MLSKNTQFNANKQAEQKIIYLENMLRESDARLKDSEEHAGQKEKELSEVLNRMREYESGDYQLQQAVNEIKGLKSQIKIRDRDIENLTKNINKIDCTLNEILEENEWGKLVKIKSSSLLGITRISGCTLKNSIQ